MKPYRTGLVVGKFAPLHAGHRLLIDSAIRQCREVVVITYANPHFGYHNRWKRIWFERLYPMVRLIAPDGDVPPNDDPELRHREYCADLLEESGIEPDSVFTSESYGAPFAGFLSERLRRPVRHVPIDCGRRAVPVSGTALRRSRSGWTRYVDPVVDRNRTRKVVLYGGESAGKSTLAAALASRLGCPLVTEFGREFTERKGGTAKLEIDDLLRIAETQVARELEALSSTDAPWVICDTGPLTTKLYSELLFGRTDPRLAGLAEGTHYDRAFLLDIAHGWVQDGDRISPEFSARQYAWYEQNIPGAFHRLCGGTVEERVRIAAGILNAGPASG